MSQVTDSPSEQESVPVPTRSQTTKPLFGSCLLAIYKNASVILVALILVFVGFSLARVAVYKIRPFERGLHMRGGMFIAVDQPGWHFQIPFVDTVYIINVIERSKTIEKLSAMTADDVTMDVSLLYTYRVVDPVQYQLEVLDPDVIVAGFVQGTLRDVINTRKMNEVLHGRSQINQELFQALQQKESRYGVEFILVQIQNASPPEAVVKAIIERMASEQTQEKTLAEAAQQRALADSAFYAAQKEAEGQAYQITTLAKAESERISLNSKAESEALRSILSELEGKGDLAEAYIQVLIAKELRENGKIIISNGETMPIVDFRDEALAATPTPAP